MNHKIYYLALLSLAFGTLQAQSSFDTKKRKSVASVEKPKFKTRHIDGSKNNNNLRKAHTIGNISEKIAPLTKSSRANSPFKTFKASYCIENKLPIFITTSPRNENTRTAALQDPQEAAYSYLSQLQKATGITNPKNFSITKIFKEDNGDTHVKLQQNHAGHPVFGAEILIHLDKTGNGKVFNGKYHQLENKAFKPTIDVQTAIHFAIDDLALQTKFSAIPEFHIQLLEYNGPEVLDTVIVQNPVTLQYQLAYYISIRPNVLEQWEYFIDAETGAIVNHYKNSCHVDGPRTATAQDLNGVTRTLNIFQEGTLYYLSDASKPMYNAGNNTGWIHTLDAKSTYGENFTTSTISTTNNIWTSNPIAVSAHYNAGVAYDYYRTVHNRSSIDNENGTIYSIINVVDEDGSGLDNAYWNGKAMFYGNGATYFKPLAGSVDVAGHEMTHGVVQNSANLIYQGEPGAINESMADIFGCMMDSSDWLLGEDVIKSNSFPSGALRSLIDPHNGGTNLGDDGWQPKHVNEKYNGTQDNGGVHINSGIPNHAFYLYATALGSRHRASKVFYRALTQYLTKSSKFIDLRLSVIQAAKDLYGDNTPAVTEAAKAFDAVGILNGQGTNNDPKLPINTGDEYLLFYNLDPAPIGLMAANNTAATLLSETRVYNKPSITDNGQSAVYVGEDKKIHLLETNVKLGNFNDDIIQDQAIWSSVSIAKDGSKIAAVTLDQDTSIYVFDLETNKQPARFLLYNPTFSEGIKSAGPVYADGLEWDYSGQYIVYDAFNELKSSTGAEDNIEYWDINIINVWDNAQQDTASGEIFKLISNLEPGESIGNPTFSKTSPNILAFDYVVEDGVDEYYSVIGLNLETNELDLICENYSLGWPSYNKNDSQLAFTVMSGNNSGDIALIPLASNKISSNGDPGYIVEDAKWGIFYSIGERDTEVGILDSHVDQSLQVHPNPSYGTLYLPTGIKIKDLVIYDKLGKKVSNYQVDYNNNSINVSELSSDVYVLKIKDNDDVYVTKFSKIQ